MINNRYELKNILGAGRSKVFLCMDYRNRTDCAIKILSKNASVEEKKLFLKEYFLLRNLNHKNIIRVFDRGIISNLKGDYAKNKIEIDDGFFTLEYTHGKSLDNYIGKLNEVQFLEIVKQISSVLLYLHSSCYVYFDLKFENILVEEHEDKLQIKFIDFGFTRRVRDGVILENVVGSIHYVAPEIIRKERTDYRSDLYSLGILLYKLIYSQFPFEGSSDLDIVKEHVERIFSFPPTDFSKIILEAVNKLISKNPSNRFQNILELMDFLDINPDKFDLKDILPIPQLVGRERNLSIIDNWLEDKSSSVLLNIKGSSGSGKTFLLHCIENKYPDSFLISPRYVDSKDFYIHFLEDLVLNSTANGDEPIAYDQILESLYKENETSFDEIKKNLIDIISKKKPMLIFDDFNLFPTFQREAFINLFPTFQINGAKIIISQNTKGNGIDDSLKNQKTLHLTALTEEDIHSFCEKTFNTFLPKDELQKLYLKYSDKFPSHLIELHRELFLFEILFVEEGNLKITEDNLVLKQLDLSQGKLHYSKINNLTKLEKSFIDVIASIEKEIHVHMVCKILDINETEANSIITILRALNILSYSSRENSLKFSSASLKEFIYQSIEDKKSLHLLVAQSMSLNVNWNDLFEIATQFEKAGDFENAFKFYVNEIEKLEKVSAYGNVIGMLSHLKTLNLDSEKKYSIDKKLCVTYKNIGDYSACLQLLNEMTNDYSQSKNEFELMEMKGLCLMNSGKLIESKEIFEELLSSIEFESRKNQLNFHLASVEFELNNYAGARNICDGILDDPGTTSEIKGRAFNLIALTEIYGHNNHEAAKIYFEKALNCYAEEGFTHLISRVKVNLGNICNILREYEKAESYWNDAITFNISIGDLDQEAFLQMNYGIYYFEKLHFNEAISFYTRANKIFETLGNKKGFGLTLYNFAEVYYETCSYEKAFNCLREAAQIYSEIDNTEELVAVLIFQALFYFELDDKNSFENQFKKFNLLLKQKSLTGKFAKEIDYVKFLRRILKKGKINKNKVKELIGQFDDSGQSSIAIRIFFQLTDYLLAQKSYDLAIELITDQKFEKLIDKNSFSKAQKLYYLGRIYSGKKKKLSQQILDYYTDALSLIENEYITVVTWKVVLEICNFYAYRGIIYKAEIYLKYLNEIFSYIIDQFVDVELKWKFESSSTMKHAYNKIHSITNLIYK